jgi:lipocalin
MYSSLFLGLLLQSLFFIVKSNNFTTVTELDLSIYMGHWHQVYAAPFDYVFQGYGKCITADYEIIGSNNVSVLNAQYNRDDEYEEIKGYAFYKNISEPGQLSVYLEGTPVIAPYWVLDLGVVVDNEYQYSIISAPHGPSLWVLARNVLKFFYLYDDEVKKILDEYQFKYVKVQQNC